MKSSHWLVSSFAFLTWPLLACAQGELPRLSVPAKEVPVPNTVSKEFQKVIARPVAPMGTVPATREEWKKAQNEADTAAAKMVTGAAVLLGVKITPTEVAGVKCYTITPKTIAPGKENQLLVHVHGGAFVFNGGLAATGEGCLLADACRMKVLSIDYRMPPDHPFPAAPDDIVAVWKAVVKEHDPKTVVMGGTSAGGGLIMTTMLRCREEKLPMPAALFIGTPGAILPKTGDSLWFNAEVDHVLGRYEGRIEAALKLYANGKDMNDPMLSPLNGNMTGWPPVILITGTRDLLLSPTVLTHRKLRAAGVPAELHVFEGLAHADYLIAYGTPESKDALHEIAVFFEKHLKR
ncbi:MAG TPA: alpha/beta hydrolase [Gemmatales bacterium]|nr:alpha/beta hydrolase [Gemmatales bacterium]